MSGYNFKRLRDIEKTIQLIRRNAGRKVLPATGTFDYNNSKTAGLILRTPEEGISARNGTQCGSAECTPYFIDENGQLVEFLGNDETSQTFTVYHIGASAIAANTYIQAKLVYNKLVADFEDCP